MSRQPGPGRRPIEVGQWPAHLAQVRQCKEMTMNGRRPTVVCLCGSTKFKQQFIEANFAETMAGRIVLTVGWFGHADGQIYTPTPEEKAMLDQLHLRKIDLADEILVINIGGYIGDSTRREIAYARLNGKPVRWLETAVTEAQP